MTFPDDTSNVQDDLKAKARREYDDAKARIHDGTNRLKTEAAPNLLNVVTDELERRKEGFTAELGTLAQTLRDASAKQNEDGTGASASTLMERGAGLVEDLNSSLENRSINDIGQSVSDYARANPAVFIGGCLLAGLAVGRLLTASAQSVNTTSYSTPPQPYNTAPKPYSAPKPYTPASDTTTVGSPASGTDVPTSGTSAKFPGDRSNVQL